MSMGLLFPAALAALAVLIVPLIIHIARRSEQQPTDFAALRWLRQRPKPRSRLRFDEWPLLLLRLALLALAALWLAQPVLFGAGDDRPYIAVVPGTQVDPATLGDARLHWLAPGFPKIYDTPPASPLPAASLIRQLDAELPAGTPLTIITPTIIEGADADRLRLSRAVTWRIAPGAMPAPRGTASPAPRIALRSDQAHASGLRYLRAAALAWQPSGKPTAIDSGPLNAPLPAIDQPLFWMGGGTLPATLTQWIKKGGQAIVASDTLMPQNAKAPIPVWRDDEGRPLAQALPMGKGRLLRFTRPLLPSQMPVLLEAHFPARLRLLIAPETTPSRVAAADYAPLTGGRSYDQPPRPLQPWLALLIALLLLAERWLATRRSRSIAP
ncbi:BatA domain-containing protein [Sphingobium sp. BYY-5]|uniref:BatA domain-containing protein n=1 Tax=Sphingobium sp. BYY-5 TaxID=2926400 RepID=UPI001FA78B24|nr:BatA domain-containing protein [Sphingobium sp. BYY-5]MCI4589317.1 BatA domain-containing protein [Sphingobium sp. BYY-5]